MKKLWIFALLLIFPLMVNAKTILVMKSNNYPICMDSNTTDDPVECHLNQLNNAIDAGDTVKLQANFDEGIEVSKNSTIIVCGFSAKYIKVTGGEVTVKRGENCSDPVTKNDITGLNSDANSVTVSNGGKLTLEDLVINGHGTLFDVKGSSSILTINDGKYTTDTSTVPGIVGDSGTINLEKGTFEFTGADTEGFDFKNNTTINFGVIEGIPETTPILTTTTNATIFEKGPDNARHSTLNYYDGSISNKKGVTDFNNIPSGYFVDFVLQSNGLIQSVLRDSSIELINYDWNTDNSVNTSDVANYALYYAGSKVQETVFNLFSADKKTKIAVDPNSETPSLVDLSNVAIEVAKI